MHAAFAAWVTAQPWRAALLAACLSGFPGLFPFSLVLAAALAVLMVLRSDLRMAFVAAVAAAVVPALLVGFGTQAAWGVMLVGGVLLAVPFGCGWLLARSGSLNLCFQLAVLLTGLLVVSAHVLTGDPATALLSAVVGELLRQMPKEANPPGMQAVVTSALWGMLVILSLVSMLSALFLGRWWSSLLDVQAKGSFGAEYRALRLGKVLGLAITAIVLAAWWSDSRLLKSLAWVSEGACFFQGLSAAHRRKARGMLNHGWLTAMYLLLALPVLVLFPATLLNLLGFVDAARSLVVVLPALVVFPAVLLTAWGFADMWRQLLTPSA